MSEIKTIEGIRDALIGLQGIIEKCTEKENETAQKYTEAFLAWRSENSELWDADQSAKEELRQAKQAYKDTVEKSKEWLARHFEEHPDDANLVDAIGMRKELEAEFLDEDYSVKVLVNAGAYPLLQLDKKACNKYVKDNAIEINGQYIFPGNYGVWINGAFSPALNIKPTISEPKIKKLAGEKS